MLTRQKRDTVEPLSNDHPHQRPSLLDDHILCDGQCFLFVRSLTNDHPSDATNDRVRWYVIPRGRPLRVQCISKNHRWRFNIRSQCCIITTRQVTRATHVRNRVCPRVELILKIIIILQIIFLGFIKSKPC